MMSCEDVQSELIAYHFATIESDARSAVEQHLLGCRACLESFMALKREIETAPMAERPSPAARKQLRRAVAREVAPHSIVRPWSWWERPLAFGFASAAVILAVMAMNAIRSSPGAMPHALAANSNASQPR